MPTRRGAAMRGPVRMAGMGGTVTAPGTPVNRNRPATVARGKTPQR